MMVQSSGLDRRHCNLPADDLADSSNTLHLQADSCYKGVYRWSLSLLTAHTGCGQNVNMHVLATYNFFYPLHV